MKGTPWVLVEHLKLVAFMQILAMCKICMKSHDDYI